VNGWLLDTNVLSELRRPRPRTSVVDFVASKPMELLHVSVVTFAEIRFGIELVTDPARRKTLAQWLDQRLRPMFDERVLALTEDVMLRWRILVEEGRKAGHTFSQPDLLIAATALERGLTVVTRDSTEYERAGALVTNPW
jgi:toxin FitB